MGDGILLNKGYDGETMAAYEDTEESQQYQKILVAQRGPVKAVLTEPLDATGDGTGAVDISVNGSVTPELRQIIVPDGSIARITELILVISDATGFDTNKFGGIAAITNGLKLESTISASLVQLWNAKVLETLLAYAGDFQYYALVATFVGIFKFKFEPHPLRLVGENNDKLVLTIRDNLTGLTESLATVRGVWEAQ